MAPAPIDLSAATISAARSDRESNRESKGVQQFALKVRARALAAAAAFAQYRALLREFLIAGRIALTQQSIAGVQRMGTHTLRCSIYEPLIIIRWNNIRILSRGGE